MPFEGKTRDDRGAHEDDREYPAQRESPRRDLCDGMSVGERVRANGSGARASSRGSYRLLDQALPFTSILTAQPEAERMNRGDDLQVVG